MPKAATGAPTRWRIDVIPPRFSPFPKAHRAPAGGFWRAMSATAGEHTFIVLAQVQEGRENYKALLALKHENAWQVLLRFESHGSHPGLHVHDWCGADNVPLGGKSVDAPNRRPRAGSVHRRKRTLSRADFWKLALDQFRVVQSVPDQEELF